MHPKDDLSAGHACPPTGRWSLLELLETRGWKDPLILNLFVDMMTCCYTYYWASLVNHDKQEPPADLWSRADLESLKPIVWLAAQNGTYEPDPNLSFATTASKEDYNVYRSHVMGLS